MKLNFTSKILNVLLGSVLLLGNQSLAQVNSIVEGFDVLPDSWTIINHSEPPGKTSYFQGQPAAFKAHSGAADSYAAANYENAGAPGTISDWYITPEVNIQNGSTISFWTRTSSLGIYEFPDRLELRMSIAGSSTHVGTTATEVGDFSILLLSVNPDLKRGVYPQTWTEFSATVTGLSSPTTGRIAFRYFVTNGGPDSKYSNYIGIDDFSFEYGVLPLTFKSFEGTMQNGSSLLKWTTINESNNQGFTIEKSGDGHSFSPIGFVAGKKNTGLENNYAYTDVKLLSGNNYYRLKQIDHDGHFTYSGTIKLENVITNLTWKVSPNPVVTDGWMQLQLPEEATVSVKVISSNGITISKIDKGTLQAGTYSIPLQMHAAASGIYVVKLMINNKTYSQTIVK